MIPIGLACPPTEHKHYIKHHTLDIKIAFFQNVARSVTTCDILELVSYMGLSGEGIASPIIRKLRFVKEYTIVIAVTTTPLRQTTNMHMPALTRSQSSK